MQPAMLPTEIALFRSVLSCSTNYAEFGAGGSTVLAHKIGCKSIISIDSSTEWLGKVEQACVPNDRTQLKTILVDIGEIKGLGYPKDETSKEKWADYHTAPWHHPPLATADTYLIDGRFRVACALQVLLRAPSRALILIHDFANRKYYHGVLPLMQELARADNLSVFQARSNVDWDAAKTLLIKHAHDPR
jgi:hypothetical protein